MTRKLRTRKSDKPRSAWGFALNHAKDLLAMLLIGGLAITGYSHFATAADVEKKFTEIQFQIKEASQGTRRTQLQSDKDRLEDKLRELRHSRDKDARQNIPHYESRLDDINQRLRNLEKEGK